MVMTAPPSAAMRAAREIRALLGLSGSHDSEVAAVISRHCSEAPDAGGLIAAAKAIDNAGMNVHEMPDLLVKLRDALAAADAGGWRPTHCFNADDWEVTYEWGGRNDLTDELGLRDSLRVGVLVRLPDKWVARVAVTGSPEQEELRWFDSKEEMERATASPPPERRA